MLQDHGGFKHKVAALLLKLEKLTQKRVFLAVTQRLPLVLTKLGKLLFQRRVFLQKLRIVGIVALSVLYPGFHGGNGAAERRGDDADRIMKKRRGRSKKAQKAQRNGCRRGDRQNAKPVFFKKLLQGISPFPKTKRSKKIRKS